MEDAGILLMGAYGVLSFAAWLVALRTVLNRCKTDLEAPNKRGKDALVTQLVATGFFVLGLALAPWTKGYKNALDAATVTYIAAWAALNGASIYCAFMAARSGERRKMPIAAFVIFLPALVAIGVAVLDNSWPRGRELLFIFWAIGWVIALILAVALGTSTSGAPTARGREAMVAACLGSPVAILLWKTIAEASGSRYRYSGNYSHEMLFLFLGLTFWGIVCAFRAGLDRESRFLPVCALSIMGAPMLILIFSGFPCMRMF